LAAQVSILPMFRLPVLAVLCGLAAAKNWTVIDSDIGFSGDGIVFVNDSVGYASGVSSVGHPAVFKTVNGGVNWVQTSATFDQIQLVLDVGATMDTVVVATVFGEQYSNDSGKTFYPSKGGGVTMSVKFIGQNGDGGMKYGLAGTYLRGLTQVQGVGITVDGGKTITSYETGLQAIARFGTFPTEKVWYVSAGTWPGENVDDNPYDDFSPRKGRPSRSPARRRAPPASVAVSATGQYMAQIAKTEDAGATWKTVFNTTGEFFFNAIDCAPGNPDWCCAGGEAEHDSPSPGARIHCTKDGGVTWTRTLWQPAEDTGDMWSVLTLQFASALEVWAAGAKLTTLAPFSWFLYSADGGITWTQNYPQLLGNYVMGLSFIDSAHAFAIMQDYLTGTAQVAAYE